MTQQTIIAHFDSRADAERCLQALADEGVSRDCIRMLPDAETTGYTRSGPAAYDRQRDEGGFWSALGNLFLPDEDRAAYAEGMSRGGVTLTISAEQAHADRIAEIAERHGAVDMDEREESWRSEGWTGHMSSDSSATGAMTAASTHASAGSIPASQAMAGTTAHTAARTPASAGHASDEEIIPVMEEQLRVGKRQVQGGRVRIRSYVVETPVQEQVSLREERVDIERRPVDRAVGVGDDAMFRERVIEAEEMAEEAVVSKETRVKEELVLRRNVDEQTRTVEDTVRRTEVEVEDDRTRAGARTTTETHRDAAVTPRRDPV